MEIDRQAPCIENDNLFVQALRNRDDSAYEVLVTCYQSYLVWQAMKYVRSQSVAEEVVQETYIAVLEGIERFEHRCSFKTWLCRILINKAITHGVREARYTSCYGRTQDELDNEKKTDSVSHHRITWNLLDPERVFLAKEGLAQVQSAFLKLPPIQRRVMHLRDIDGLDSQEVCQQLHLSPTNQRVLLHRARFKVRQRCRPYLFND